MNWIGATRGEFLDALKNMRNLRDLAFQEGAKGGWLEGRFGWKWVEGQLEGLVGFVFFGRLFLEEWLERQRRKENH